MRPDDWRECIICSQDFGELTADQILAHLKKCIDEKLVQIHPEVCDEYTPEDGCEHLSPRDTGEGPESEDELYPPEDGNHHSNR